MVKREEPQMNNDEQRCNHVTERTIGAAYSVSNELGVGFLERPYENALVHELRLMGLQVEQQVPIKISYKGVVVGEYIADLIVEGCVLVEVKAVKELDPVHEAQCLNYLRATGLKICLLINFGKSRVTIRRLMH